MEGTIRLIQIVADGKEPDVTSDPSTSGRLQTGVHE